MGQACVFNVNILCLSYKMKIFHYLNHNIGLPYHLGVGGYLSRVVGALAIKYECDIGLLSVKF